MATAAPANASTNIRGYDNSNDDNDEVSFPNLQLIDDDSVSSFSLSDLSDITTTSSSDNGESGVDEESSDFSSASCDKNDEMNSIPKYLDCNFLEDRLKDASVFLQSRVIGQIDDDPISSNAALDQKEHCSWSNVWDPRNSVRRSRTMIICS